MNTFKQKSLYAALAGVSALGATGAAQAVSVNPDGLGQVLIYPYYTVRDKVAGAPYQSLLSVVNSSASAKAVKVRFLEGRNSQEVLDFNLYLSARDVWVAAIVPTADGAGIFTPDLSCTTPRVSADPLNPTRFVNYQYLSEPDSLPDTSTTDISLDRTREGYVEIIEMGNLNQGSVTETASKHVSGIPPCSPSFLPADKQIPISNTQAQADTVYGGSAAGGLFGGITLINVLAGEDFTTDAVALEGFSTLPLWAQPGSVDPTLEFVNPKVSVATSGTKTYVTNWQGLALADPVSAVLMHNNIYNEFVLDSVTKSRTDWVMTMPTKKHYIAVGSGTNTGRLFQRNFNGNAGSCDDVVVTVYDREERQVTAPGQFSPPPPTRTDALCWESTVVTFNSTNVFGSKNNVSISTSYQNGWARLQFATATTVPADKHRLVGGASYVYDTALPVAAPALLGPTTFTGLPVIGFAAITFENGTLPGPTVGSLIQSQYGGSFNHKQTRAISTPAP